MNKEEAKALSERLCARKNDRGGVQRIDRGFCDDYIEFINRVRTERAFVKEAVKLLEQDGFSEFSAGKKYVAGDKVYYNNRGKALIAATVGRRPLSEGLRIVASHADAPRLDLKQNPLYEDKGLALFKTHYYGGIKKYQWAAIPLALCGVAVLKDGRTVEIDAGGEGDDITFCITDLLPHLSHKLQDARPTNEAIKGEELNILIGSEPIAGDDIESPVKLNILNILNEKYGITEEDFVSAELEAVPAFKAKYVGFDRSLIGAYGHDDRVCAYASLRAALACDMPEHTALSVFADKEETGSEGSTGLDSDMLRQFITQLCRGAGEDEITAMQHSMCMSADTNAAVDPTFADVLEYANAAKINGGVLLSKYTGSRGKYSTNDASAEFVAYVRRLLDGEDICWQTGEMGKVDEGGGGTVAKFVAALGIDTLDVGVGILSCHAPYEVASALDLCEMHRAFFAFIKD